MFFTSKRKNIELDKYKTKSFAIGIDSEFRRATMKKQWTILCICFAAFTLSAQLITEHKENIEIKSLASKNSSYRYPLPAFKVPVGKKLILSFDAYLKSPAPAGWGGYLELRFHSGTGKKPLQIGKFDADGNLRLLRRGKNQLSTLKAKDAVRDWWKEEKALLTRFTPSADKLDPRITSSRQELNCYTLDITDISQHAPGELEFINRFDASKSKNPIDMHIENLKLEYLPEKEVEKVRPENDFKTESGKNVSVAWKGAQRTVIKTANFEYTHCDIKFPAIRFRKGYKTILVFDIYLKTNSPGGWNYYAKLSLNGQPVGSYCSDGNHRLLRRGPAQLSTLKGEDARRNWWNNDNQTLLVRFTPRAEVIDPRITAPKAELNRYFLDISDLCRMEVIGVDDRLESAGENLLHFTNSFYRKNVYPPWNMVIENLHIIQMPEGDVDKIRAGKVLVIPFAPSKKAAELSAGNMLCQVTASGGNIFRTRSGKDIYFTETALSYPHSSGIKFNRIATDKSQGISGWKPVVSQKGNTITVSAKSANYRFTRTIKSDNGIFTINDTIENTSNADTGIRSEFHYLRKKNLNINEFRIAGVPGAFSDTAIASNPTLFIKGEESALGVMCLDDVFRIQMQAERTASNRLSAIDATFGLGAGKSYTFTRLVVPVDKPDYFAFINKLRRHLGLNFTIRGIQTDLGGLAIQNKQEVIVNTGLWYNYHTGAGMPKEEHARIITQKRNELRAKDPNVKVLPMFETNLVPIDKRKIPGGEKLPSCGKYLSGVYGAVLTAEQTRLLTQHTPYKDSMLFDAKGCAYVDTYYASDPYINLLVRTDVGNTRYKELEKDIIWMLDELGMDGIYFDQFNQASSGINRGDRCSFDRWDGVSVLLDKNGNIQQKFSDSAITCCEARRKLIELILSRKKIVKTNGQPISRLTAALPTLRFQEMELDPVSTDAIGTGKPAVHRYQGFGHLSSSPLILGLRPMRHTTDKNDRARIYQRGIITALRNGILYVPYGYYINPRTEGGYGIMNHMCPITIEELGDGFIIGKERILTAVSRDFITADRPVKLIHCDKRGNEIPTKFAITRDGKNWKTSVKLADWNETAVIVLKEGR